MKASLQKKGRVIIQEKRNWPGDNFNEELPAEPNANFYSRLWMPDPQETKPDFKSGSKYQC
jgi:hypothetical protein